MNSEPGNLTQACETLIALTAGLSSKRFTFKHRRSEANSNEYDMKSQDLVNHENNTSGSTLLSLGNVENGFIVEQISALRHPTLLLDVDPDRTFITQATSLHFMSEMHQATATVLAETALKSLAIQLLALRFNMESETKELLTRGFSELHEEGTAWYLFRKVAVYIPSILREPTHSRVKVQQLTHRVLDFACTCKWMMMDDAKYEQYFKNDPQWQHSVWQDFKKQQAALPTNEQQFCLMDVVEWASAREMMLLSFLLFNRTKADNGIYQYMSNNYNDCSSQCSRLLELFWRKRFYSEDPGGTQKYKATHLKGQTSQKYYGNLDLNYSFYSGMRELYPPESRLQDCSGTTLVCNPFPWPYKKVFCTFKGQYDFQRTLLIVYGPDDTVSQKGSFWLYNRLTGERDFDAVECPKGMTEEKYKTAECPITSVSNPDTAFASVIPSTALPTLMPYVNISVLPANVPAVVPTAVVPAAVEPAAMVPAAVVAAAVVPAAMVPAAMVPAAMVPAAVEPAAVEPAAVEPAAVVPAAVEPAAVVPAVLTVVETAISNDPSLLPIERFGAFQMVVPTLVEKALKTSNRVGLAKGTQKWKAYHKQLIADVLDFIVESSSESTALRCSERYLSASAGSMTVILSLESIHVTQDFQADLCAMLWRASSEASSVNEFDLAAVVEEIMEVYRVTAAFKVPIGVRQLAERPSCSSPLSMIIAAFIVTSWNFVVSSSVSKRLPSSDEVMDNHLLWPKFAHFIEILDEGRNLYREVMQRPIMSADDAVNLDCVLKSLLRICNEKCCSSHMTLLQAFQVDAAAWQAATQLNEKPAFLQLLVLFHNVRSTRVSQEDMLASSFVLLEGQVDFNSPEDGKKRGGSWESVVTFNEDGPFFTDGRLPASSHERHLQPAVWIYYLRTPALPYITYTAHLNTERTTAPVDLQCAVSALSYELLASWSKVYSRRRTDLDDLFNPLRLRNVTGTCTRYRAPLKFNSEHYKMSPEQVTSSVRSIFSPLLHRDSECVRTLLEYSKTGTCTCASMGRQCSDGSCENRDSLIECHDEVFTAAGTIECNCSHGQGADCGNRLYTNITNEELLLNLKVQDHPQKGKILVVKKRVKKGDLRLPYVGEICSSAMIEERKRALGMDSSHFFMRIAAGVHVDARNFGGIARYASHSCLPNCFIDRWIIEGQHACYITNSVDLEAGVEVQFDYFAGFSKSERSSLVGRAGKGWVCSCGNAESCMDFGVRLGTEEATLRGHESISFDGQSSQGSLSEDVAVGSSKRCRVTKQRYCAFSQDRPDAILWSASQSDGTEVSNLIASHSSTSESFYSSDSSAISDDSVADITTQIVDGISSKLFHFSVAKDCIQFVDGDSLTLQEPDLYYDPASATYRCPDNRKLIVLMAKVSRETCDEGAEEMTSRRRCRNDLLFDDDDSMEPVSKVPRAESN